MLNSVSGSDWYRQHQTHANNLQELTAASQLSNTEQPEQELADKFYDSGLALSYKKVATNYRMAEISFPEVIKLRQDLFDEGLISIQETNTLTLATQTKPDNDIFNLSEALEQYSSSESHFHIQRDLSHLQKVVANLNAAEAS